MTPTCIYLLIQSTWPRPRSSSSTAHGAWHNPTHYNKLTSALRALGHSVLIPRLHSMNADNKADLYTETDQIRSYVESLADAGHAIIVLMHSYGGQVGTNALTGLDTTSRKKETLPGGIVRLLYMCAHALTEGTSMFSIAQAAGREQFLLDALDISDDGMMAYRDVPGRMVGQGLAEDEMEGYVAGLGPWNGRGMYQELRAAAWRGPPVSYIFTLRDRLMPVAYQAAMVEGIRAAGGLETFDLSTGHCAHVTMTGDVVGILHAIVNREICS
ncbi:alpha/beta-hydrolase [Aspergillus californicus]